MPTQPVFYSRVFGLVVAALLGYALLRIFAPFFNAMSWAAFLAFLLYPLNLSLRRRLHGNARAAAVLTVLTPIVVLLPLSALSVEFVAQVSALVRVLQQRARELDIRSFSDLQQFPLIARANGWLQAHVGISADQVQSWVISASQDLVAACRRAFRLGFPGRARIAGRFLGSCCASCSFFCATAISWRPAPAVSFRSMRSARTACFASSRA